MPLQTLEKAHKTILNKFDQVLSSIFLMAKINYWLGFSDTHALFIIHSKKSFAHYFFLCLVFVFCFFSCSVSNSRFQLQIFVPSNSALKPFWGSSTYHTDNFLFVCLFTFFCTSTTTSRSSWGWGANFWLFFFRNTGLIFVFVSVNFVVQWGQIDVLYKNFSRSNFWGLVVQFVTFLKFLGGTSTIQVKFVVFTIKIPFWV